MFVPVTSRKNCPVSCLSSWQLVTTAISAVGPGFGVHWRVARERMYRISPCSFPNAHPAGCPATGVVRSSARSSRSRHEHHERLPCIRTREVEVRIYQVRVQHREVRRLDRLPDVVEFTDLAQTPTSPSR